MRARRHDPALAPPPKGFREAGVEVHLDASGDVLAARAGTLIKSPGVPQDAPVVAAARARGMPVLGELELAWRLLPNEFIAVTGTNGKTTTTEWIGHIHREAALPVAVAGNVGTAATSLIGRARPRRRSCARRRRFSSRTPLAFAPEVAVLLNLSPDHLDRHPTATRTTSRPSCGSSPTRATTTSPWPRWTSAIEDLAVRTRVRSARPGAELSDRDGYLWWDERAADRGHGDLAARRAQPRQRDGRRGRLPRARDRARRPSLPGCGRFAGGRPPAGADHHARRRRIRQRLQGHQRGQHDRRAADIRAAACT